MTSDSGHSATPYYEYVRENMTSADMYVSRRKVRKLGTAKTNIYCWLSGRAECPNCGSEEKVYYENSWHSDTAKCPDCEIEILDPFLTADFPR